MPPISVPLTPPDPPYWINCGDLPKWLNVEHVCKTYREKSGGRVRYVGELATRNASGNWDNQSLSVFWQEKLLDPAHSHYFALFRDYGSVMIKNAQSAADHTWVGGMHPVTGEIVFSRERWDRRKPRDGSFAVDGGPDGGGSWAGRFIPVKLRIIDGIFRVVEVGPYLPDV